jgi:hypothetical protein
MSSRRPILKYELLFNWGLVLLAVLAGAIQSLWIIVPAVLALGLIASLRSWVSYKQSQIQPRSDELQTLLRTEVLPRLHKNCILEHPDECPDLRVNVMFKRWRGLNPWRKDFLIKPWERTLKIEASYIGPESKEYESEAELEWKTDQGVAGDAMNPRAEEVWTSDEYDGGIDPRVKWGLSETQYNRTAHLNSVLSCPIYLPSDEENVNPIGVINLDSELEIGESQLNNERIRDEVIYWSSVIGAIVE